MQADAGKDDKAHLQDILKSAQQAVGYVRGQTFKQFWDDAKTRDAVAMRLHIMGEAAGRLTPATMAAMPVVAVHQMRGMRNRIAHTYDKVDFVEVWKVLQNDLKPLISELEKYFRQQQAQEILQSLQPKIVSPKSRQGPRMGM